MPTFVPGIELSRRYFETIVRPILDETCPELEYAAALIGPGSDALGFDTDMSTDHDWGPRLFIFVSEHATEAAKRARLAVERRIPNEFLGYATRDGNGATRVVVETLGAFVQKYLAYDLDKPLEAADWLTFPSQTLLEITSGAVYHDANGELTALRQRLAYYPRDVWLYLLASGWQRIGQEEHLMARAGYVGDDLGASLIGARLVRDVMNLCFLMERQYAPYPKWFGTSFGRLRCASKLQPSLVAALRAENWRDREATLARAFEHLAEMHNALGVADRLPEETSYFHSRPFRVIGGERFAEAIRARISSPELRQIAARRLIGNIDQFSDNTDLRVWPESRQVLRQLYR